MIVPSLHTQDSCDEGKKMNEWVNYENIKLTFSTIYFETCFQYEVPAKWLLVFCFFLFFFELFQHVRKTNSIMFFQQWFSRESKKGFKPHVDLEWKIMQTELNRRKSFTSLKAKQCKILIYWMYRQRDTAKPLNARLTSHWANKPIYLTL